MIQFRVNINTCEFKREWKEFKSQQVLVVWWNIKAVNSFYMRLDVCKGV